MGVRTIHIILFKIRQFEDTGGEVTAVKNRKLINCSPTSDIPGEGGMQSGI